MKAWSIGLVLMLIVVALAGCGGDAAPSTAAASPDSDTASSGNVTTATDASSVGDAPSTEGQKDALPASNQLGLGTLMLAETENAITAEQAKTLLPLWQAIQGGSLQSEAETNAVVKQIEGAMTAEQLVAIAAMQLTMEDLGTWLQEQGLNMGPPASAEGGPGSFANMSEEEREAMRATAQAGGGMPGGGGQFGNMSEEERAAMRATAEASGMTFGNRAAGAGQGQLAVLAGQVVELLAQRAAE